MVCAKYDILSVCCNECDVKNICEYRCRKKYKLLCSYFIKHKIEYSCIFRKKLNKEVDKL